ncbi:MAG TPA: helix-turn-helix transcriptional regulator [Candidatus Saccharibacteria bacterium]|nr:helix-turn-helix transcriptional regulator [Candidatus Saccharibacteria bacterium]HMR38521.1 helix-turn-helix transcriptional regulator [Candidatus Saccharibacteria bacterium]
MTNKVKENRKSCNLRQEDLAALVGVSRQTIIAIENEKYSPSLELGFKIAKVLNEKVEDVFFIDFEGTT